MKQNINIAVCKPVIKNTSRLYVIMISLALVIVAGASCNKDLDMAPDGKLQLDEVFADNTRVEAFLNSCYSPMPVKGTRYFFWSRGPVVWSDDAWDTDAEAESWIMAGRMYNGDASAGNVGSSRVDLQACKLEYSIVSPK